MPTRMRTRTGTPTTMMGDDDDDGGAAAAKMDLAGEARTRTGRTRRCRPACLTMRMERAKTRRARGRGECGAADATSATQATRGTNRGRIRRGGAGSGGLRSSRRHGGGRARRPLLLRRSAVPVVLVLARHACSAAAVEKAWRGSGTRRQPPTSACSSIACSAPGDTSRATLDRRGLCKLKSGVVRSLLGTRRALYQLRRAADGEDELRVFSVADHKKINQHLDRIRGAEARMLRWTELDAAGNDNGGGEAAHRAHDHDRDDGMVVNPGSRRSVLRAAYGPRPGAAGRAAQARRRARVGAIPPHRARARRRTAGRPRYGVRPQRHRQDAVVCNRMNAISRPLARQRCCGRLWSRARGCASTSRRCC